MVLARRGNRPKRPLGRADNTWFYLLLGGFLLFVISIIILIYMLSSEGNSYLRPVDSKFVGMLADIQRYG